jgi:hypothetical protein
MPSELGSNDGALSSFKGDIIADTDAPLISTQSTGGKSYALGSSLSAGIYTMVQNGTFKATPPDPDAALSDTDNPLPYFSLESNYVSGAQITASSVEDSTVASGRKIRFTIPVGTAVGQYLRFVRYVAIPGSVARTFTYQPRSAWKSTSSTTEVSANLQAQFYQSDIATTSGTSETRAATLSTITSSTWAYEVFANPNSIPAIPTDAAFIRVAVGVVVNTLTTSAWTVDLHEVRIDNGSIQILLSDQSQPGVYGYGTIYLYGGTMWIRPNEIATTGSNPSIYLESSTGNIGIDPAGSGEAKVLGNLTVTGSVTGTDNAFFPTAVFTPYVVSEATTSSSLILRQSSGQVILQDSNASNGTNPRLSFYDSSGTPYATVKSGASAVVQILSGNSATTYGQLWAGRIYPMNGSTASRYIYDDGSTTRFTGAVTTNGDFRNDTPGTLNVTPTTSGRGAIWTLVSGTNYVLNRYVSTSTAEAKKNIAPTTLAPEQVYALNLVDFEYDQEAIAANFPTVNGSPSGLQRGVIWEQVNDVIPEAAIPANESTNDPRSIDWEKLYFGALVAIQDLNERLKILESK